MARKRRSKKVKELNPKYRVRLDSKTIITLKDISLLSFWKQRYPQAELVSNPMG